MKRQRRKREPPAPLIAAREAGKQDGCPTITKAATAATKRQLNYLRELPGQERRGGRRYKEGKRRKPEAGEGQGAVKHQRSETGGSGPRNSSRELSELSSL